jgi:hypothetical protein
LVGLLFHCSFQDGSLFLQFLDFAALQAHLEGLIDAVIFVNVGAEGGLSQFFLFLLQTTLSSAFLEHGPIVGGIVAGSDVFVEPC